MHNIGGEGEGGEGGLYLPIVTVYCHAFVHSDT